MLGGKMDRLHGPPLMLGCGAAAAVVASVQEEGRFTCRGPMMRGCEQRGQTKRR